MIAANALSINAALVQCHGHYICSAPVPLLQALTP